MLRSCSASCPSKKQRADAPVFSLPVLYHLPNIKKWHKGPQKRNRFRQCSPGVRFKVRTGRGCDNQLVFMLIALRRGPTPSFARGFEHHATKNVEYAQQVYKSASSLGMAIIRHSHRLAEPWADTNADPIPSALQIPGIYKKQVSRQNIPLKHGYIQRILQAQMKQESRRQHLVT
jgi:hypothetical protein